MPDEKKMIESGVLMRLVAIRGDEYSIDEMILPPGPTDGLRWTESRAEYRTKEPGGMLEAEGLRRPLRLSTKRATILDKGQWHQIINTTKEPLTVTLTLRPPWNPKRAFFRVGDREMRGDEVWFELRTYLGDRVSRAMFRLHELAAKEGNVSVLLAPKANSLESFHKGSTVAVTAVKGSGVVRIDGKPRKMKAGDRVVVNPGQRYQLQNPGRRPWQVKQVHRPQWEPHDTFYVYDGRVVPGDQVWFEFVVPG